MQIREALMGASSVLINSATPSLDARLLLSSVLNYSHEELLLKYDSELSPAQEKELSELLKRRESTEPMAYILGSKEFYGYEFLVDKNVLIPRPDTELVVEEVIKDYNKRFANKAVDILDLGTGSGAIAITLAKEILTSEIDATDISKEALQLAKKNSQIHKVEGQINFIQSDWYSELGKKKYDYIISNPPYISEDEKDVMAKETLLFEPTVALYASNNGLAAYKIIIESALKYLKPSGKLVLEIGYQQRCAISNVLKGRGFTNIITKQDLAGHDRVIISTLNNLKVVTSEQSAAIHEGSAKI